MKIVGEAWCTRLMLDRAYNHFKKQIVAHHNSDPFIVAAVGSFPKENMDFLLEKAKIDLNLYYIKMKEYEFVDHLDRKDTIYILKLKGNGPINSEEETKDEVQIPVVLF